MVDDIKRIMAEYDREGVYVYQAFKPSIAGSAIERGTFDKGFSLDRMSWIKPSFGWMLYRSAYASKPRQEVILKIKVSQPGFLEILAQSVETSFRPGLFESESEWRSVISTSDVRHQWDPDRAITGVKLDRRAIQIGIRGLALQKYVNEWIMGVEDVTELARDIKQALTESKPLPNVPPESEYVVDDELNRRLGISCNR